MQPYDSKREQVFCVVADFLELDEDTFQRMLPDLVAWHSSTRKVLSALNGVKSTTVGGFIWIDDGKPGNCGGVTLGLRANGKGDS